MNDTAKGKAGFATRLTWDRLAIDACAEAAALQKVAGAARRHRPKHRQRPCIRASR